MESLKQKAKSQKPVQKKSKEQSLSRFRNYIEIKGARSNNLKNVDLKIPKNKLIVVTGVSGSGKSSLTMDTLYAEGQRRYVESLSSYARQFLMRMKKPEVDLIKGICPAIAIEQKVSTSNARSTVGTLTEIYDYLRLLYARIGKTISPISGAEVRRHQVSDVVTYIHQLDEGSKVQLFIPLKASNEDRTLREQLHVLLQKGYTRILNKDGLQHIDEYLESDDTLLDKNCNSSVDKSWRILIDRFVVKHDDEENRKRIADSVNTSFYESRGDCLVMTNSEEVFNNRYELDGISFLEPVPNLFNYNNPYGACKVCEGFGKVMGIDENKVIPDKTKSVFQGCVAPWRGEKGSAYLDVLVQTAGNVEFPIHRPYLELTAEEKEILWEGNQYFDGINSYFSHLEEKIYKIQNRVILARYRGKTHCHSCKGGRLRKEATYVKVGGKSLPEITSLPIDELLQFIDELKLSKNDSEIGNRLLLEIKNRLTFMDKVGLGYLMLNRISSTLSGGETQRINLTRTLGSNLTSSLYILDEPSIGLHPKDTGKLVDVLKRLRDLGNTVLVVEHEEDVIRNADYLIDVGPEAGIFGGHIVYQGPYKEIFEEESESLTAKYLKEEMSIEVPSHRRKISNKIKIKKASQHNLKSIDATIPLQALTVVTGVSGSGKTTLVKGILYPALLKHLGEAYSMTPGIHESLEGDLSLIANVEMVNQNPIGKSSRSNPVTYVKAYDAIRKLMTDQQLSKIRGFQPKHFSFNVDGGRCDTCKGEGEQVIEMQFLADIKLECEDCGGKRFKREVLDVRYKEHNIADILALSIDEGIAFFADEKDVIKKLQPLQDVGLGYIKLGQSSSTLSGGEAQRVKLASFLGKADREKLLFIFDEPTTGLHFHDIKKLLKALNALVENGHTVVVVEHNMEVIKSADWLIDLGPDGGKNGGNLVFEGRPEDAVACKESHTGHYLKKKLQQTACDSRAPQ